MQEPLITQPNDDLIDDHLDIDIDLHEAPPTEEQATAPHRRRAQQTEAVDFDPEVIEEVILPSEGEPEEITTIPADTQPVIRETVTPTRRPGNTYVRARLSNRGSSAALEENEIPLNALALEQKSFGRRISDFIFGKPLELEHASHERIGIVKALALLSSDALSSVAYGTEASLAVLVTAGVGLASVNLGIGFIIVGLLGIVAFSYRQTIMNYPQGGGSYIVSKEHLGVNAGLIAAAALLLDYVLTVSVSVSAGVNALTSQFPALHSLSVEMGVFFIIAIMVINLRGVRESGSIFAVPTYLFVGTFIITILVGFFRAVTTGGITHALPEAASNIPQSDSIFIFLILTAFASGCSAMTGTEAIADGVPVFRGETPKQQSQNAAKTLIIMASLLAFMYGGTTYLAWRFGITPQRDSSPTLLYQMATHFFGSASPFVFLFTIATTLILILAANTSFSDFPRLSSILARDNFMPHLFGSRNGRMAFNSGIMVLSVLSGALLIAFKGNTEALINLYALGVFLAFTLSQSAMVEHWRAHKQPGWKRGMVISGIGATATGIVTIIILISKAPHGAWIVAVLIPIMVVTFRAINTHYGNVSKTISAMKIRQPTNIRHVIIVPVDKLNNLSLQALAYARSITPHVIGVHVTMEDGEARAVARDWDEHMARNKSFWRGGPAPDETETTFEGTPRYTKGPDFVAIASPRRALAGPVIDFIEDLHKRYPLETITVLLPEYVVTYPWEYLLHNRTALRLKFSLLSKKYVTLANLPYYQDQHILREAQEAEDRAKASAPRIS